MLEGYKDAEHSSIGTTPNIALSNKDIHPRIWERSQKYNDKFIKNSSQVEVYVAVNTITQIILQTQPLNKTRVKYAEDIPAVPRLFQSMLCPKSGISSV